MRKGMLPCFYALVATLLVGAPVVLGVIDGAQAQTTGGGLPSQPRFQQVTINNNRVARTSYAVIAVSGGSCSVNGSYASSADITSCTSNGAGQSAVTISPAYSLLPVCTASMHNSSAGYFVKTATNTASDIRVNQYTVDTNGALVASINGNYYLLCMGPT